MRHVSPRPPLGRTLASLAAAAITVVAVGGCGDDPVEPPTVRDGWAVPVERDAVAVYLTILAPEADELTAARVARDVAARTEVVNPAESSGGQPGHLGHLDPGGSLGGDHDHTVALPAGRSVALEPGGAYLALGPLTDPVTPGDTFPVTLSFREAADVTVDVTVRPDPS